ncbi:dienelactone hydrolase family protein [Planosporangium thailandense]|uniref:Dienelactone hydrolase family protein n=1 Tax=Planosporangium thailandense TaxID=765197 RepID=A0ABX0XWT9_9ACTN|nr:dienelactone hydrolase family protein [Planosporangium thailandense]
MCYDADATPPRYGAPVTTATGTSLILTSADGTRFDAYLARPGEPSGIGLLVLPDNRGLSGFYTQLCVRLAEQGHTALAVDYFGRSAGVGYAARRADFGELDNLMPHLGALTRDGLYADFDAALDHLRTVDDGVCRTVLSLGFCMGGRFAFQTAEPRFRLAGAIGLYGAPDALQGRPGPIQLAPSFTAPILGMFGGADEGIPVATVEAFDGALTAAGVPHDIVVYPGAPHGFFELSAHEFADAQADAWRRILAFARQRDLASHAGR